MAESAPVSDDGSEEVFDVVCTPCSKRDGRNVQGVSYCVDCQEIFCQTCTDFHARFSAMAGHKVVIGKDIPADVKTGGQSNMRLPKCRLHAEQSVNMLCQDHDAVACSVCIGLDHRTCRHVAYIPTVAAGIKESIELTMVKEDISETLKRVKAKKSDAEADLEECEKNNVSLVQTVEEFRDKLLKRIEELENNEKELLQKRFDLVKIKVESQVRDFGSVLSDLEEKRSRLDVTENIDDTQVFIDMKQGSRLVKEARKKVEMPYRPSNKITFMPSLSIDRCIQEQEGLGKTVEIASFTVSAPDDSSSCDITDICQLDDGTILLADHNNFCIKRCDKTFKLIDKCMLYYAPECMCFIKTVGHKHRIAVTIMEANKVQFLEVGFTFSAVSPSNSIDVGCFCNGIAHKDSNLFVLCIPSDCASKIAVYSLEGKLIRNISFDDAFAKLLSPSKITFNTAGNKLYVADMRMGMVVISLDGRVLPGNRELRPAMGVCNGPDGQVYICGMNNIVVSVVDSRNNTGKARSVVTKACGLASAQAVCFDKCYHEDTCMSRLIVSRTGYFNEIFIVVVD